MTATEEEFDLDGGAPSGLAVAEPTARTGRREPDRPTLWVALAAAATVLGVIAAPPVLTRSLATAPPWSLATAGFVMAGLGEPSSQIIAGLASVIMTSDGADPAPGAGGVMWVVRMESDDDMFVSIDTRLDETRDRMVSLLEDRGPALREDWVCELLSDTRAWCGSTGTETVYVELDLSTGTVTTIE